MIAAYLRRSVSKDPTKEVSREAQEAACRRIAGAADLALYIDWGVSGGSTTKRPEYQRLRADVDDGTVTAVLAYSVSRLARSARELLDFLEACRARGVTVTTEAEGAITGTSAMAKFVTLMMAGVAEMERDLASERTLSAHASRRERGDHIGPTPYGMRLEDRATAMAENRGRGLVPDPTEDFGNVTRAYQATRSMHGTARRLNETGVPTRHGRPWSESSVRTMLRARAPELLPRVKGIRAASFAYLFTGLLICPFDGTRLAAKNRGRWAAYSCRRAYDLGNHPHPRNVSEAFILPWVQAETARLAVPAEDVKMAEDTSGERAALAGRLDRAHDLYIAGEITRERHDQEAAAVAAALDRLGNAVTIAAVPEINWTTWPTAEINTFLRALWPDGIRLGPDLRPLAYPDSGRWSVPHWRRPD
jgi:DNA invertase Pin-like site-specific DNA recombinase